MHFTVDRFEENFVVCENRETKQMVNIEISKLPKGVKEGDIIKFENNTYKKDDEETKKVKDRIQRKFKDLWE